MKKEITMEQMTAHEQKTFQQGAYFMRDKAIEAFRQFVEYYCSESGRDDIAEESEHYIKVFKKKLRS